jgi:hypothetical protein
MIFKHFEKNSKFFGVPRWSVDQGNIGTAEVGFCVSHRNRTAKSAAWYGEINDGVNYRFISKRGEPGLLFVRVCAIIFPTGSRMEMEYGVQKEQLPQGLFIHHKHHHPLSLARTSYSLQHPHSLHRANHGG